MLKKYKYQVLGFVLSVMVFATASSYAGQLNSLIMPNASAIVKININTITSTKIYKNLDALLNQNSQNSDEINDVNAFKAILKKYGLNEKDVKEVLIALDAENVNIDDPSDINSKSAQVVVGMELSKDITFDDLKNIINESITISKNQKHIKDKVELDNLKTEVIDHNGSKVLVLSEKNSKDNKIGFAIYNKNIVVAGIDHSVKSALDRLKSNKMTALSPKLTQLQSDISPDAQSYLIAVMPENIRKTIDKSKSDNAVDNSQKGPNVNAVKDISALSIQVNFSKDIKAKLITYFLNQKSAEDVQKLLNQFLPLAKFQAMMLTQGNPLPCVNSFQHKLVDNKPEIEITFEVNEQDINTINKLSEQKN